MPSYEENGINALRTLIRVDESDDLHLINAVKKGDFNEVEKLLKENKENPELDLDYRNSDGATALFYAASKGYDKIVEALIANGANKDIANYNGETPLFKACSEGHLLVVEQLGKAGVDVNKGKEDVATSIGYLLKSFPNDVKKVAVGTTPLHSASTAGHRLVVRELLRLGADVEGLEGKQSPLWFASKLGNHETVRELINSGADVNKAIPGSPSPLFLAIQYGRDLVANELISSGADVNKAFKGVMPIYEACVNNRNDIAKALFNAGADVGCLQRDDWSRKKINFGEDGEMLKVLVEITNQKNIDERDAKLARIIIATKNNNIDEVTKILKEGVLGINYQDEFRATALFYAAERGYDGIAKSLIEKGANLDLGKKGGATPLFEACANNHNDIAKALFRAGADVGCLQENGWFGPKLKEELELVGDEMKQLIKEFINPENIKNRDKKLENRRKPNNLQPDNKVDPSEGIALSTRDLPGR